MKQMIIAGFAALGLCGDLAAGSIYKCTDAAGNVSFSQTACPAAASGGEVGYSRPSQRREPDRITPLSIEAQVRQLDSEKKRTAAKNQPNEDLGDTPSQLRKAEKDHLRRAEGIRGEAMELVGSAEAARKCAAAKSREQAILRSDPQAEYMRALDLFENRSLQDLFCEKYEKKVIRSQGSEVPYVK